MTNQNAPDTPINTTEQLADAQTAPSRPAHAEPDPSADSGANTAPRPDARETAERDAPAPSAGPLLDTADAAELAQRWEDIQAGFVDQPRQAVSDADALVAQLIQRLTRIFADEHARLEAELDRDEQTSTEDLRIGLRRYRDFFHRLLAT